MIILNNIKRGDEIDMGKITISLNFDDEKKLRERAIKNYRSISREISYLIHKIEELENQ